MVTGRRVPPIACRPEIRRPLSYLRFNNMRHFVRSPDVGEHSRTDRRAIVRSAGVVAGEARSRRSYR